MRGDINMLKIAPSILSADFANLLRDVRKAEEGGAEYLHIDVMDGHFVPNITIGPLVVQALRPHSKMLFDVHLMIENPDNYLAAFVKAGADLLTVHVEACRHLHRTIQNIKELGVKAGVALNPHTSLTEIEYILEDVDLILLMTVNPGFGGQKFIHNVLPKIRSLRAMLDERGSKAEIQVDGGVTEETASLVTEAGARVLVAGSAVFGKEDVAGAIQAIRAAGKEKVK